MVLYIHFKLKCLYPTAKLQISLLELNDNCKLGQEGTILAVFNIAWHQCINAPLHFHQNSVEVSLWRGRLLGHIGGLQN